MPEKRAALEHWATHLVRPDKPTAPSQTVPPETVHGHVDQAKARALALCRTGKLHEAVLSICMDLSRHPTTASSHLEILGRVGLERAAEGSRDQVENWIGGFR